MLAGEPRDVDTESGDGKVEQSPDRCGDMVSDEKGKVKAEEFKRKIAQPKPEVTVLTDIDMQDGTSLDKYCVFHFERGTTIAGFRSMVKEMEIVIRTPLVWLQVGNCQIPQPKYPHVSPVNQIKKLVTMIVKTYPLTVKKVYVSTVLPRADREAELEVEVMNMNKGFAQAVRDLKNYGRLGRRVAFVATHRIFLERFKYVDLLTGQLTSMVRIVKPLERYFQVGTPKLNVNGKIPS